MMLILALSHERDGRERGGLRLADTGQGRERDDTWVMDLILLSCGGRRRDHNEGIQEARIVAREVVG